MNRRTYVTGLAGTVVGLAGCAGILEDSDNTDDGSDGTDRGPAETVEAFYDAVIAGDTDAANDVIHPDGELPPITDSQVEELRSSDPSYENATVDDQSDGVATVTVDVDSQGSRTVEQLYELRRHDGEWKLYGQPLPGGDGPRAPTVEWDSEERTNDEGQVSAVAFTHGSGDDVDVARLRAGVGDDLVGPAEGGTMQVGDTVVVPFTVGDEGYEAGTSVTLSWNAPQGDTTVTIAEHRLGTETAGQLGAALQTENV